MNMFSILIYFANVVQNIDNAFGFLIPVGFLALLAYTCIFFITKLHDVHNAPYLKWPGFLLAAMVIISVFVPSRNTVIAIAASEMTEEAIKSDLGRDAYNYAQEFLRVEKEKLMKSTIKKPEEEKKL